MRPEPVVDIVRLVALGDPVLIAPHGRDYHEPFVLFRTYNGAGAWGDRPRCGAHADRWVAVDLDIAVLLDRAPCSLCAAFGQTTITDAEISAPEPDPGPRVTTKGKP